VSEACPKFRFLNDI
jgi:hypothetical protein